jgi:hypothetical protein
MPNELLSERLQSFTPEYRDFVTSDFVETASAEEQINYRWDDDTREAFENMLFLNITLFLNRIELVEVVIQECNLTVSDAMTVVNNVLTKLPKEMVVAQQEASLALTQSSGDLVALKDRFNFVSSLPQEKQSIYFYVKTTRTIDALCQKNGIVDEVAIETCHSLLGDINLGFYKIGDTVPLLQQELKIDARTAALLGADVIDFLTKVSDSNFIIPNETLPPAADTVTIATDRPESTTWTPPVSTAQPIASPYVPTPNVAPEIHTMASDANAARAQFEPVTEPVYSSEQPVIRKNLSDTPSYATPFDQAPRDTTPKAPIEPPRWGV